MARITFLMSVCSLLVTLVYSSTTALKPAQYQPLIGCGFSTNYFKTLDFSKYNDQNIDDIADAGFNNLRLRCRADLDGLNMTTFLNNLEHVVDKCLNRNIIPIVSWIHHEAEANATEEHRLAYVEWWRQVADKLKKKDYRLSYNLFTELGIDACGDDCSNSLRENTDLYNYWTKSAVDAIRLTGKKNRRRILILGSPKKTAKSLNLINETIFDKFMMVEWHIYASGPNKKIHYNSDGSFKKYGAKYWNNTGDTIGKQNVDGAIQEATDYTNSTGKLTYLGAWMAQSASGELNEEEVIHFAKYFVQAMGSIPWSLNVLDRYYNTKDSVWLTGDQTLDGQTLNMSRILTEIQSAKNL